MPRSEFSIVEFFGADADEGHSCGYCKNESSSRSHGMWAHSLMVQDYQDLIDHGWRRSGLYCYKPLMNATCCPQYTIKCVALDFQISKSQKKILKKMKKFLAEGLQLSDKTRHEKDDVDPGCIEMPDISVQAQAKLITVDPDMKVITEKVCKKVGAKKVKIAAHEPVSADQAGTSDNVNTKTEVPSSPKTAAISGDSYAPCRKAKVIRRERWMEKMKKKGIDPATIAPKPPPPPVTIEQLLVPPDTSKHHLELRLVQSCPPSAEFSQSKEESFQVYHKYQVKIHNDPPEKVTMKQFLRFLVNSPLEAEDDECGVRYGSFHQQYWLDGQLIAVGVLDILPSCVSSVYFYYDPDFSHLSLGTYAALREVALTRELQLKAPKLEFYYMGFYIHSCPKMRYKGQYTPSHLLCPVSCTWHRIEACRAKLDVNKYCVFSDQPRKHESLSINEVLVLHRRTAMPYRMYAERNPDAAELQEDEVQSYIKLVGSDCAARMLLVRI